MHEYIGSNKNFTEHEQVMEWLRQSERSTPEVSWREQAMEDYRFYASKQDTEEVKAILESQGRPYSVWNYVAPLVNVLVGMAAQTKHETTFLPASKADEAMAELMSGVHKHYRRQLHITNLEIECFRHMVLSGRSFMYFYVDTENPFKPKIAVQRLPGYHCWTDPEGTKYDLSDHRFFHFDRWLTEDQIKQLARSYGTSFDPEYASVAGTASSGELPTFINESSDHYRVVETWYKKLELVRWFINPMTGKSEWLRPGDFDAFAKQLQEGIPTQQGPMQLPVPPYVQQHKYTTHQMLWSGDTVLYHGESPYQWEGFPVVFFGAYEDEDENRWMSVVENLKEPQRALNTVLRQMIHLLNVLPKGMLVHEAGTVLNIEEYETRSSEPNFHLELRQGGIDKYKFETQPPISPIYQQLFVTMQQSMKDLSGIQDPLLGVQTTSREPGVSVRMRQETSLAVVYTLYDNFRTSREHVARLLLSFIQQWITTEEVIRIEGQEGAQLLEINTQVNPQAPGFNDIGAGEYDLVVQDVTETTTMKMAVAQMLAEFAHNNPGVIPPHVILEYTDLPYSAKMQVFEAYREQQELQRQLAEAEIKSKKDSGKGSSKKE